MVTVRVRDRGRDLAVHQLDTPVEAEEIKRIYLLLGYARERIVVEHAGQEREKAA